MIAKKFKRGDEVRVLSPSRSLSIVSEENIKLAVKQLESLGLKVSFGKNSYESDSFGSSSISSRIQDLNEAFADKNIKGIITSIGGFNSNQLLKYLDYDLIKQNPKIFCGYSDITALQNAILAKTGLVTYSGPHFSTFAIKEKLDFTIDYFKKCLFDESGYEIKSSEYWSDDAWYLDQDKRHFIKNSGFQVLNYGSAKGEIVGGNLCTLNLLQGTPFFPNLENSILLLEEDEIAGDFSDAEFDRNLQSLIHLDSFSGVKGILIGRFQKKSKMTDKKIIEILKSKKELNNIPIVFGLDFGHTDPMITFPIGGMIEIHAHHDDIKIRVLRH